MERDNELPSWISNIQQEDWKFIKEFLICSGSLKEIAKIYDVSYPTVRLRLDRLIEKIKLYSTEAEDEYILFIKELVIEDKISIDIARVLIDEYRRRRE